MSVPSKRRSCWIAAAVVGVASLSLFDGRLEAQANRPPGAAGASGAQVDVPARVAVDYAKVDAAIQRGKTYIYSQLNKDGHWETGTTSKYANDNDHLDGQFGGRTALSVYTLIAAGESPNEPRIAKAIEFLKTADVRGTYALGFRQLVWLQLPPSEETKKLVTRDTRLLLAGLRGEGSAIGQWTYVVDPRAGSYSHSRTQYGVLGLWAAAKGGVEVPETAWRAVIRGLEGNRAPDGGWTYKRPGETEHPTTPGMTAAVVASLLIAYEQLADAGGCTGNPAVPATITGGLKWIEDQFDKTLTDEWAGRAYYFPTLYAIERVGLASGLQRIGRHDWYGVGANWLLTKQGSNGAFTASGNSAGPLFGGLPNTCFAVLFLSRGRNPVAINKLEYPAASDKAVLRWNQRPRDVASLAWWMGRQAEQELRWQIVSIDSPVESMLEAPILFISGSEVVNLDAKRVDALRRYAQRGGLIVAHADCSSRPFAQSIQKVLAGICPESEFRPLPANHPILVDQQFSASKWQRKPQVLGLSNGVREVALILPTGDPGRTWTQLAATGKAESAELMANVYQYMVEQDVRSAATAMHVAPQAKPTGDVVPLARLRLGKGHVWNPEPLAWETFAARTGVRVEPKEADATQPLDAKAFPLAHITGVRQATIDPACADHLKAYVNAGGTLLIDCAGGSGEFADSVEPWIEKTFGKAAPIANDSPFFTGSKLDPKSLAPRAYAVKKIGAKAGSRLQGVTVNGRLAVIYSRDDLTHGLLGRRVDGIIGYKPDSAEQIARAAIRLATGKPSQAASKPTTRTVK